MYLRHVLNVMNLLDDPHVNGKTVKKYLTDKGLQNVEVRTIEGAKGSTDTLKITIPGASTEEGGRKVPTLGIIGQLGGVGARPSIKGLVSDADGAIVALASALSIGTTRKKGDTLAGDVIITTHIAPDALPHPHDPMPFIKPPVDVNKLLERTVDSRMDAILSIDATKANRVIKVPRFAITPTVKEGWILKVSDDLIDIYKRVRGDTVAVVPITMQDITPSGNNVYHINSIMQPWRMTTAPVVGVATTARVPIAGSDTGANHEIGLEMATRFCVEVAKHFTRGDCAFYDTNEFQRLFRRYGDVGNVFTTK